MALSNCVSVVLLVVLVVGVSGFTKSCHSPDTYGESNTLKPLDANSESLVLVNSSSHGKVGVIVVLVVLVVVVVVVVVVGSVFGDCFIVVLFRN